MISADKIEELGKKITSNLPPVFGDMKQETENTVKQILQSFFTKMNLVTREEFEIQQQVLLKTRQKLEALEERLKNKFK